MVSTQEHATVAMLLGSDAVIAIAENADPGRWTS